MSFSISKKLQRLSLGQRGEHAAKKYLAMQGYKILATNFANKNGRRLGEIDIIAQDGEEIVFIEVKTRSGSANSFYLAEESITRDKLYKLNKTAIYYLSQNKIRHFSYRFDAIALIADELGQTAKLKHIKNIYF